MAENNREYFIQDLDNGSIQISEDVVAATAATAALEVEGVCGLGGSLTKELVEMLGKKSLGKGVRITTDDQGALMVNCDVVAKFGFPVFDLAKEVQETIKTRLESVTGLTVGKVNVTICGITLPRDSKK